MEVVQYSNCLAQMTYLIIEVTLLFKIAIFQILVSLQINKTTTKVLHYSLRRHPVSQNQLTLVWTIGNNLTIQSHP
jgi:hypothetical protein